MNLATLALFALPGLILLACISLHTRRREREFTADLRRFPRLRGLRSVAVRARVSGMAGGALVGVALLALDRTGRLVAVAPAVAGIVLVVAVMLGQRLARDAARVAGQASLERRATANYLPGWPVVSVSAALALLAALLAWTTARAAETDLGRVSGFAFECVVDHGSGTGVVTMLRSPFTGAYYSIPIAISTALLVAMAGIALWTVTMRPRNGSDVDLVRLDDALRRQTSEGIVAGVGLSVGITLMAVGGLTAMAAAPALCHGNPAPPWVGLVLGALGGVLGWGLALWALVHLLRPTSGLRP